MIDDGWGDDDLDFDESVTNSINEIHQVDTNKTNDGGAWEFDDNSIVENSTTDDNAGDCKERTNGELQRQAEPDNHYERNSISKIVQELKAYVQDLNDTSMLQSLNGELKKGCNTTDAALQLCRYYHDRPKLKDYTLESELPRMDYQVMVSDELILTTVDDIQEHFRLNPVSCLMDDMLLRASNQSLLADMFPILTGVAGLIRSQFMASAVATKCRFVLDMRQRRSVHVESTLTLCIPTSDSSNSSKLDLASIRVAVEFSPEPDALILNYQVKSIVPLIDAAKDWNKLRSAAELIESILPNEFDTFSEQHPSAGAGGTLQDYHLRDNFLQSLASTQSGFKSALRDLDNVVNVSSKLNYIRNNVTSALPVLPSAEEILMADNGVSGAAVGRSQGSHFGAFPRPPPPPPPLPVTIPFGAIPRAQPPPPPPHPSSANLTSAAPKPIIGGFLMSGISRLAKAAALPQIPTEGRGGGNHREEGGLKLYRVQEKGPNTVPLPPPPPPIPSKLSTRPDRSQAEGSTFHQRDDHLPSCPTPPPPPVQSSLPERDTSSSLESSGIDGHQGDQRQDKLLHDKGLIPKVASLATSNDTELITDSDVAGPFIKNIKDENECEVSNLISNSDYSARRKEEGPARNPDFNSGAKEAPNPKEQPNPTKVNPMMETATTTDLCHVVDVEQMTTALDTYAPSDFVYQVKDGIIPTRRRFVSCAGNTNLL